VRSVEVPRSLHGGAGGALARPHEATRLLGPASGHAAGPDPTGPRPLGLTLLWAAWPERALSSWPPGLHDAPTRGRRLIRPAFVPRTIGTRQATMGTIEQRIRRSEARVRSSSQVVKSALRTLSRWRHGFKSRWDYAGQRPFPGVTRASGPALAPRRTRGRHDGPHGFCLELGLGDRAVHSDDLVGERGLPWQVRTVYFHGV